MSADDWSLGFVVSEHGAPVGIQEVAAKNFATTGAVTTGSWLLRQVHGRGLGKEMRSAVLHLAFAGLDASEAYTSAFDDNPASLGVTRALGYQPNGSFLHAREGEPARALEFVLTRSGWEGSHRDDIEIVGLEPCLPLLRAEPGAVSRP